jgi:hypothetical protein
MGYDHTQRGHFYLILALVSAVCFVSGWNLRNEPMALYICWGIALLMFLAGMSFITLTVRDMGDVLDVRFGPIPLFGKSIRYADIQSVATDRTNLLDGWGVHWVPGRGTTYNIWGFECVRLSVRNRTIRVGTDDAENLCEFIRSKLDQP